jgi:uncharacterized protein (DUF1778 family)
MKQNKTISMSIRVSAEELKRLKEASEKLSYSSYSEFVRRTALIEADRILSTQSSLPSLQEKKS